MENDFDDMEVVGFCCLQIHTYWIPAKNVYIHRSNVFFRQGEHADVKIKDVLLSLHVVSQISHVFDKKNRRHLRWFLVTFIIQTSLRVLLQVG